MKDELCHCGTMSDAQDIAIEIFKQHFGPDCCPIMICQIAEHLKKLAGGALTVSCAKDLGDKATENDVADAVLALQEFIDAQINESLQRPAVYGKSRDTVFEAMGPKKQNVSVH
jgi:hypothetical protein